MISQLHLKSSRGLPGVLRREEKKLESSLDSLIQRVTDIKSSTASFLFKLENEYEHLSWQTVLDNFALLSGQLNSLGQFIKSDKMPHLRSYTFLPLMLSPDCDPELEKLTDGRVAAFTHEVVPDHLRTKPEPEAEERAQQINNKAVSMNQEQAQKQLNNLNRITSNILDIITSSRQDWDRDSTQRTTLPQTSSQADTHALVAAICFGKGLKRRTEPAPAPSPAMMMANMQQQQQKQASVSGAPMKAVSAIKTNIRAGGHPYQRP